ncbi:unnamed protein product [Pedinophyceae sp. YPF-701]|nr:unnamed protein product [Pedinophyceae sp. YPF-701]
MQCSPTHAGCRSRHLAQLLPAGSRPRPLGARSAPIRLSHGHGKVRCASPHSARRRVAPSHVSCGACSTQRPAHNAFWRPSDPRSVLGRRRCGCAAEPLGRAAAEVVVSDEETDAQSSGGTCSNHDHHHHHDHGHGHAHGHSHGAAAVEATDTCCGHDHHAHHHDHHDHAHSHGAEDACGVTHSHDGHGHSDCCGHSHFGATDTPWSRLVTRALKPTGILAVCERLSHGLTPPLVAGGLLAASTVLGMSAGALDGSLATAAAVTGAAAFYGCWAIVGTPAAVDAIYGIGEGRTDVHVLMTLAAVGTVFMDCANEGALLLVLFALAHALEDSITGRAQGDLSELLRSTPPQATRVTVGADGSPDMATAVVVDTQDIAVGDTCLVRAGENVPVDGRVVFGQASVTSAHVTGEAAPRTARPGTEVSAGSTNEDGVLLIEATRLASDSTPARIARMTEQAQGRRPKVERWIDGFGANYSRVVLFLTVAIAVAEPLFGVPWLNTPAAAAGAVGAGAATKGSIYRALGFLAAAAPCALTVATLPYAASISLLAKRGVLIKGGEVLDALCDVTDVALDKTGTITTGRLECTSFQEVPLGPTHAATLSLGSAWSAAVALARFSNHPASLAIAARGIEAGPPEPLGSGDVAVDSTLTASLDEVRTVPGAGIEGGICIRPGDDVKASLGSLTWAASKLGPDAAAALHAWSENRPAPGLRSVLVLERAGHAPQAYVVDFEDEVPRGATDDVAALERLGLDICMLSGDREASVAGVARRVAIRRVKGAMSPEDKLGEVAALQGEGRRVLMVGDGINDAPALATASVGAAVAETPNTAATAASDVVLLRRGGVSRLPALVQAARRCRRLVQTNVGIAMVSILVAAVPAVAGFVPLWLAVLLHEGATVLVALNSLRALSLD